MIKRLRTYRWFRRLVFLAVYPLMAIEVTAAALRNGHKRWRREWHVSELRWQAGPLVQRELQKLPPEQFEALKRAVTGAAQTQCDDTIVAL